MCTSKFKCQLWTAANSVRPSPLPPPWPWLTSGQTCSYYYIYVGQFWCPDCDWSAFNAILLNGSVKMVRFERWHAQISAQSGRVRSPVFGLSYPGLGLGLSACYAIHMLDIFMKLLAGRRHRPAIRGKQHMWSFSQKLSQTPFRHGEREKEKGRDKSKPHFIWVFLHYVTQG